MKVSGILFGLSTQSFAAQSAPEEAASIPHVHNYIFYKVSARKPMVFRPWEEWRSLEIIHIFY